MAGEVLSDERTRNLRRLLLVDLGFAALIVLLGVVFLVTGRGESAATLFVIGVIFAGCGAVTVRAVDRRSPSARRLVVTTGVVLVVLSILLVDVVVGLLTVLLGIGLLVVLLAPEREEG